MLPGIRPQLPLEQLPAAVQAGEHRSERHVEHEGDLLHLVPHHVHEHERKSIQLRQRDEHRADVLGAELLQEVDVHRIRVRERILVCDCAEQRELVDLLELDLLDSAAPRAPLVAAAVEENAREPFPAGLLALELREAPIGSEQALLNDVLGLLADQSSGEAVEARKLLLGEDSEPVGRSALAVIGSLRPHHSTTSQRRHSARRYCIAAETQSPRFGGRLLEHQRTTGRESSMSTVTTAHETQRAGSALRAGTGLMMLGAAAFIGYAIIFLVRNFTDSFLELGIGPGEVSVGKDEIEAFSPSLYDYIGHLHIAVSGFIAATGLAVIFLSWFGVRRGQLWAWVAAVSAPVLGLAVALPAHYPYGFDTIGHLGLIYLATAIFVVGAVLALKALLGEQPQKGE